MRLVILCAMQAEAEAILEGLRMTEKSSVLDARLPFRYFETAWNGHVVALISSGTDTRHSVDWIGMEAATLMAYTAVRDAQADLLVSAGTAGGFARHDSFIGEVVLSDGAFWCHDHHVPLPGFEHSTRGGFISADVRALARQLGLRYGPMSSGSSLSNTQRDLAFLQQHGIIAKEMEVAAEALVAYLTHTPIFAVKAITNLIDEVSDSSAGQFSQNFALACSALGEHMQRVIPAYLNAR